MIDSLKEEILKYASNESERFFFKHYSTTFIIYLVYLKYLCEKGIYSFKEVIMNPELYEITDDITRLKQGLENHFFPIHSILRNYEEINSEWEYFKELKNASDLLLDFLNELDRPIHFHGKETPIYVGVERRNYAYYDETGHSIYIIGNNAKEDYYDVFKIFDEILGITNQYLREEDINLSHYHYLYVYDDTPKYRFIKSSNEYTKVRYYLSSIDTVILCSNYSKISNFQEGRIVLRYLKTVILSTIKVFMIFQKDLKDEISIINYDKEKILSEERLLTIIQNNRKLKDILIKTNYQEIKDNNMRIGFQLYQLEKKKEIQDINKIVDENTEYLRQLNVINERVEREINRLLNK